MALAGGAWGQKAQVPDVAEQRRPSGGRTLPRREEGLVQERRQLSSCWVSTVLRPFSRLGRTKNPYL